MFEHLFLLVMTICGASKLYFLGYLFNKPIPRSYITILTFLVLTILGTAVGDLAWVIKYWRVLYLNSFPYSAYVFLIRVAHALFIVQYQTLSLLLSRIISNNFSLSNMQKSFIIFSSSFIVYFLYTSLFSSQLLIEEIRTNAFLLPNGFWNAPLEVKLINCVGMFLLPWLVFICASNIFKIKKKSLPKVVHKQIDITIWYFYIPLLIIEFCYTSSVMLDVPNIIKLTLIASSSTVLTFMLLSFLRNIFKLRFLNSSAFVSRRKALNFVVEHSEILSQVKKADAIKELYTLAQQFFASVLSVKPTHIHLHVRSIEDEKVAHYEKAMHKFLQDNTTDKLTFLEQAGTINEHDLEFDLFYESCPLKRAFFEFLKSLNISVLTPLFCRNEVIGFVAVHNPAPHDMLIDATQRDEMILFSQALQAALMHIEHTNLRTQHIKCKRTSDALRLGHNKFERVRRTLKKHLEQESSNHVGLVFYRSGTLVPGNQIAQDLLPSHTRSNENMPLIQACKQVAESVEKYRTPKHISVSHNGKKYSVSSSPSIDHSGTMLFITNTELLQAVREHPGLMIGKDDWEYLLCIGTSKTSRLLDQFLPGTNKRLVEMKVALLRAALQCSPIWLSTHKHDSLATARIIHQLSEREQFEQYQITPGTTAEEFAKKLFGVSSLIDTKQEHPGMLHTLHQTGTIMLESVDLLPLKAQKQLASFLATDEYQREYGRQLYRADVRLIITTRGCSLSDMVIQGQLCKALAEQLYTLNTPNLHELNEADLVTLANGFLTQLAPDLLRNYVSLTKAETRELLSTQPESLTSLQKQMKILLSRREIDTFAGTPVKYAGVEAPYDPLIESAVQRGKKTLQDQALMAALWKRCKNQQRIAQLLGVNRSSVSRRCKEYGLS